MTRGLGIVVLLLGMAALPAPAAVIDVPGDQPTIQAGLDAAQAGDVVRVAAGVYGERVSFPRSGQPGAPIALEAAAGARPVLDGTGAPGCDMVLIASRSHVRVRGFEIRNALGVSDCSGIRVIGSGAGIELRDNVIHDIRGTDAMGITVYGTDPIAITGLVVDGNVVHDCEPSQSEAITLNGNVDGFAVTNNVVRDVNNIGIDFIGGETSIQPDTTLVARNGLCAGNTVLRANSNYGGGYAGGIYVDGGRDIVIERNVVSGSDLGIEIGAENAGIVVTGIVVRNNVIHGNEKAGLVFGGYDATVGSVELNRFTGNTLHGNDTLNQGLGEIWIQYARNNVLEDNVVSSTAQNVLLYSEQGNVGNTLDWNVWTAPGGEAAAQITWQGTPYQGFESYRSGTGQDGSSLFADPLFSDASAGDFHLGGGSPAIDAGDPGYPAAPGETDIDGQPRVANGRVDAGADEAGGTGPQGDGFLSGRGRGQPNPNEAAIHALGGIPRSAWVAYGAGQWGTLVAAGDVDGDGVGNPLTGPGPGAVYGPQVRAFHVDGSPLVAVNLFAYGTLRYGVNVGSLQVDGDVRDEIGSGAGPGAVFGPHVRGFELESGGLRVIAGLSFFAYGTLRYGANLAAADVDADGATTILTGPGPSAVFGAQVRGFEWSGVLSANPRINFLAFPAASHGVHAGGGDVDGDAFEEIVAGRGPAPTQAPELRGFDEDGAGVQPLPGFAVTLAAGYGARGTAGDVDADGIAELVAGPGEDPAAAATVATFDYDGVALTPLPAGTFTAYTGGYGVVPATGTFGP